MYAIYFVSGTTIARIRTCFSERGAQQVVRSLNRKVKGPYDSIAGRSSGTYKIVKI